MYTVIVDLTINETPIVLHHITEDQLKSFTEQKNSDKLFARLGGQYIKNRLIENVRHSIMKVA